MMECTNESDDLPGLLAMAAQIAFEASNIYKYNQYIEYLSLE